MFGKLQRKSGGKKTLTLSIFLPLILKTVFEFHEEQRPLFVQDTLLTSTFSLKKKNKQKTPQEFEKLHLQGLD